MFDFGTTQPGFYTLRNSVATRLFVVVVSNDVYAKAGRFSVHELA